jgi:hypothetical protein
LQPRPQAAGRADVDRPVRSQFLYRLGRRPRALAPPPMPPLRKLFRSASQQSQGPPSGRSGPASSPFPGVAPAPHQLLHTGSVSHRPGQDCRAISPQRRAAAPFGRKPPRCGPRRESSRSRDSPVRLAPITPRSAPASGSGCSRSVPSPSRRHGIRWRCVTRWPVFVCSVEQLCAPTVISFRNDDSEATCVCRAPGNCSSEAVVGKSSTSPPRGCRPGDSLNSKKRSLLTIASAGK